MPLEEREGKHGWLAAGRGGNPSFESFSFESFDLTPIFSFSGKILYLALPTPILAAGAEVPARERRSPTLGDPPCPGLGPCHTGHTARTTA